MIRRPGRPDLLAALAGAAMLTWSAVAVGAWVVLAALGVLAAAFTTFRWPGTAAAASTALAQVAHGPSVVEGLVAGLLVGHLSGVARRPTMRGRSPTAGDRCRPDHVCRPRGGAVGGATVGVVGPGCQRRGAVSVVVG